MISLPLSWDVPSLILENCVRMHAILFLSDLLWNPVTSQEDLPTEISNSSSRPSFYFGFGFLEMAPVSRLQVRHTSLWYWTWRWTWSRWHQLPGWAFRLFSQRVLCRRCWRPTAFSIGGQPWDDKKYEIICFADDRLPVLGQSWLLTADPLIGVSLVFACPATRQQAFPPVIAHLRTDWDRERTLVLPSWVCTSPFAVNTTVGCSGPCCFVHLSWALFFFAHHVHWCSWTNHEFALLWSRWSRCWHDLCFF